MPRLPVLLLTLSVVLFLASLARAIFLAVEPNMLPPTSTAAPVAQPIERQETSLPTLTPTQLPTLPPTSTPLPTPPPTSTVPPLSARYQPRPGDTVTILRPGVVHISRVTDDPLRINLLLFDLTIPEVDLAVGLGDGWLSGRHRPSYVAQQQGALAAVNGDLFGDSGLPQGLTIVNSRIVTAPKRRATFAWTHSRRPIIGYFTDEWTWSAEVVAPNNKRHPLTLVNSPCPEGQLCLFNRFARSLPARAGDTRVLLDREGRVSAILRGEQTRILTGTQILQGTGTAGRWLREHLSEGDRPEIITRTTSDLRQIRQAISGGPIILRDGEFVQDCLCALRDCSQTNTPRARLVCEDFTTDWKLRHYLSVRMPRTGIGYDQAGETLIVAVVDGYQRGYSRGMTQEEFAALLREFGADTAMELDGGGSSTMVVAGKVVNRPPDETGERYVANSLLFFWRKPED